MEKIKVCSVFGTRPEAIKMAPVVLELQKRPEIDHRLVVTGQHRSMLDQMLNLFKLTPDFDLEIMLAVQSLTQITTRALERLEKVFREHKPDLVLVHGDTTTSFVGALAAYYAQVKIGHVEAGLRTGDKYNPYPEEMNRSLIDAMTDILLAPTISARDMLLKENVPPERIFVTGNTVIDALLSVAEMPEPEDLKALLPDVPPDAPMILVEAHRRENWGDPIRNICLAIRDLAKANDKLHIAFPVHLNPKVKDVAHEVLDGVPTVHLLPPQDYLPFVFLMKRASFIMTDSGGIQEEAPALGRPVLVLRTCTERPEAIAAGTAMLVGPDRPRIVETASRLLNDPAFYASMASATNPYGDGKAAARIAEIILHTFGVRNDRPPDFSTGK